MAKLGEGDARWIVAERQDGTNCNAWHWEEKDLSASTHTALKAGFKDFVLASGEDGVRATVKELSDISGDVTIAQRKGKIMCYFDIKLTMKWSATVDGDATKVEGKITAPEIDHDSFQGNFELGVSSADSTAAAKKAEAAVRAHGRDKVRAYIRDYFNRLFEQHHVGTMLKQGSVAPRAAQETTTASANKPAPAATRESHAPKTTLAWKLEWRCPCEDLWTVLTDAGRASVYTRAAAKIDPRASGTFEFLGGLISGYFVDVVPYQKLAMQWRLSSWSSGQFTSVIIQLNREEAGVCRLEFAQAGIPDGEFERVRDGWLRNFWDPIKAVFGYNYEVIE